jgi:hypothetical protein
MSVPFVVVQVSGLSGQFQTVSGGRGGVMVPWEVAAVWCSSGLSFFIDAIVDLVVTDVLSART